MHQRRASRAPSTANGALAPHPRLYLGPAQWRRLDSSPRLPILAAAQTRVLAAAEACVASPVFDWKRNTHNAHLLRARRMQTRVINLLTAWRLTDEERYRRAAVAHVLEMGAWEYWSWITWRQGNADPAAIFDLSYGENAATLAIAWDGLYDTLSAGDRRAFVDIARHRALRPFLAHTGRRQPAHWYGRADSNWNTVCAGGAGMLALAMHEELAEARRALPRCEGSIEPYMRSLRATDGGWTEGIGYWNYGMRYAFMYLLSHERATGCAHPLLRQKATSQTLRFPMDFAPNGVSCSFGDANNWRAMPFHYAAAERLGCADLVGQLDASLEGAPNTLGTWPDDAELLLLHPRRRGRRSRPERRVARLYRGMQWGLLADRWPRPRLYAAVRGGDTDVPHGHRDLLSFWCVVDDEALIENLGVGAYLDTTFGPRRYELFETMPTSKNTLLINGAGVTEGSTTPMTAPRYGRHAGLRLEATTAMGSMRDGQVCRFAARAFVLLGDGAGLLIVDRVELAQFGRPETRLHSRAAARLVGDGARLAGQRQQLSVACAADVPARLWHGVTTPTTPQPGAQVLRWCPDELHERVTLVTLLVPGRAAARVSVLTEGRQITVASTVGTKRLPTVRMTTRLRPA